MSTLEASAAWITAPGHVEIRAEQVPPPGPGMVRARTLLSAFSHGTERLVYRGEVAPGMALDLPTLAGSFALPIKYGYAAVGRVIDVGDGVGRVAPGELVFALHPHQTVLLAPEHLVTRLPNGTDPLLGLFVANLETAVNIAHDAAPRLGETALVFGQGVVGLLVAQALRLAGARRVFAVDPLPHRRALSERIGVDAALAPGPGLAEQIRSLNNGRAADLAVEVSGSPVALQGAIECVMDEGTVVVASWYGTKTVTLDLGGHFHRGRVRLRSSQVGRLNPELGPRWDFARRTETVVALLAQLQLAPLVTHRLPFEQAAEGYRLIDERSDEIGQVVLEYEQ